MDILGYTTVCRHGWMKLIERKPWLTNEGLDGSLLNPSPMKQCRDLLIQGWHQILTPMHQQLRSSGCFTWFHMVSHSHCNYFQVVVLQRYWVPRIVCVQLAPKNVMQSLNLAVLLRFYERSLDGPCDCNPWAWQLIKQWLKFKWFLRLLNPYIANIYTIPCSFEMVGINPKGPLRHWVYHIVQLLGSAVPVTSGYST